MSKLFSVCSVLFTFVALSPAVFSHDLPTVHAHGSMILFDKHYWTISLIALGVLSLTIMRLLKNSK